MDYDELEEFIHRKMKMTHIYQPIMIRALLESRDNKATVEDIARKFLNNDESQLNYYKKITKRWPHITLRKRGVVSYEKGTYTMLLDRKLTRNQRRRLKELCDLRLDEFIDKDPWIKKFREMDKRWVTSGLRYDVLSRSRGVCVACGARSTEAMLHVDHIIPRSLGGRTEPGNLQALCSTCNTQKRNRDERNFLRDHYRLKFRRSGCPLCKAKDVMTNELARAVRPREPLADGHVVVAPGRHVGSFMELIPAERQLCLNMVDGVIERMREDTGAKRFDVTGFDRSADHFHVDVVPAPGAAPRARR